LSATPSPKVTDALWQAIGDVVGAHVVMLRDEDIFDEPVAQAVLTAWDGVRSGAAPERDGVTALVAAFDALLDALISPEAAGAGGVARSQAETAATAMRLLLRDGLLETLGAIDHLRLTMITFAGNHTLTIMPGYGEDRPLQPTTLAHWLTGTTGPLSRAASMIRAAYPLVNQSAMGAGNLAGTNLRVNREAVAAALGCDAAIASTFDALSATDAVVLAIGPCVVAAGAVQRLAREMRAWLRMDPGSLRVAETWLAEADPALPQARAPRGLDRLVGATDAVLTTAGGVTQRAAQVPHGPVGETGEQPFLAAIALLAATTRACEEVQRLFAGELEVNRAWLASRAGRDFTTVGDLADFLLLNEGLDPASCRAIATMVIRRTMDEGHEATGITTQGIDAVALLVIGRELGIEMEKLGAWLAPRRFLERRTATGSAAQGPTRDLLEMELTRARADERWREERLAVIAEARQAREREISALLDEVRG